MPTGKGFSGSVPRIVKDEDKYTITIWWYPTDGRYYAEIPDLQGCIADGSTYEEALNTVLRARDAWIETAQESGWKIPKPNQYRKERNGTTQKKKDP